MATMTFSPTATGVVHCCGPLVFALEQSMNRVSGCILACLACVMVLSLISGCTVVSEEDYRIKNDPESARFLSQRNVPYGTISVVTIPSGATVEYLDSNREWAVVSGTSEGTPALKLPQGVAQLLRVKKPGYVPEQVRVLLPPENRYQVVTLNLRPLPGGASLLD